MMRQTVEPTRTSSWNPFGSVDTTTCLDHELGQSVSRRLEGLAFYAWCSAIVALYTFKHMALLFADFFFVVVAAFACAAVCVWQGHWMGYIMIAGMAADFVVVLLGWLCYCIFG